MMKYYREPNGDYLAVEPSTASYYRRLGENKLEGRASAISGHPNSVCTTGIGLAFLTDCTPVKRSEVPKEWLKMF